MSDEIILHAMRYNFDKGGCIGLLSKRDERIIHDNIKNKRCWDYIDKNTDMSDDDDDE